MKKSKIYYIFKVLVTPNCWLQNHSYSAALDYKINSLLDSGVRFTNITDFNASLCELQLWIRNHPYASFTSHSVRPSRATILRARDFLEKDLFNVDKSKNI